MAPKPRADVAVPATTETAVEPILSQETIRQFANMVTGIPSEDGSGYERIFEQLMSATSWDQLDAPWETTKVEALRGRVLRVDSLTRRPSDFKTPLGIFLVVRYTDTGTGETGVLVTGSLSVVGQLVRAFFLGHLPCYVEWIVAERATPDGFHPHHLKFHGVKAVTSGKPDDAGPAF